MPLDPIALVHDMGTAILKSVAQVFPTVPGTVCHFHFLRDIGKDLMTDPYNAIRRRLRTYNVQPLTTTRNTLAASIAICAPARRSGRG